MTDCLAGESIRDQFRSVLSSNNVFYSLSCQILSLALVNNHQSFNFKWLISFFFFFILYGWKAQSDISLLLFDSLCEPYFDWPITPPAPLLLCPFSETYIWYYLSYSSSTTLASSSSFIPSLSFTNFA